MLENNREWHRLLYNAALQERIDAWQKCRKSITYNEQQNILPQLKKDMPELVALGSQALQEFLSHVIVPSRPSIDAVQQARRRDSPLQVFQAL